MIDRGCIDDSPAPARHLMEGGHWHHCESAAETFRQRPVGRVIWCSLYILLERTYNNTRRPRNQRRFSTTRETDAYEY